MLNERAAIMHLILGQLVYTSFAKVGFRLVASDQVPIEIQQAFIEHVASKQWDSYAPPKFGYRAVYLYQVTREHSLFGWLYNDGTDDKGRYNVPYFICYYLAGSLHTSDLVNIFTCLHKGPVALIDRYNLPAIEAVVLRNLWSYQAARSGVGIALGVRRSSYILLNQGELLNLFVSVYEQQMFIELNGQTCQQQVGWRGKETHRSTGNLCSELRKRDAYRKNVSPVKVRIAVAGNESDTSLPAEPVLPQMLSPKRRLKIGLRTTDNYLAVPAYKNSRLLLGVVIAATVLALIVSIYTLLEMSIMEPRQDIPSVKKSLFFHFLKS